MEAPMLICMILNIITLMLTSIPLLASIGAIRSAWKNNTNSREPMTFFRWVKKSSEKISRVAGDLSLTALALTVLVAVIRQWALTTTIQLVRVANLWEASLGVFSFTGVIWRRYLYTRTRLLLGLLSLLTWVASTLGLCISFTLVGHKLGLWLFSADVTVACLVRAVCAIRLLMEFDPEFDPDRRTRRWWGWWDWRRDETPLGNALVYNLILSATMITIVWVLGAYVLHEQNEPFSYFELKSYTIQMLISNLLLTLAAMPKAIRYWWPGQVKEEAGSSGNSSSSQENLNGGIEQSSPPYPNSMHKSENDVIAEPNDATC